MKEINKYVHFHGAPTKGKILLVLSSPAVSTQTGWPIGYWGSELTHPLLAFRDAGYEVVVASTEGGELLMDAYSDPEHESGYSSSDIITIGFKHHSDFQKLTKHSLSVSALNHQEFDAIFLVGGQGPMHTFRNNETLQKLFVSFYEAGKPVAAVCHATTLLLEARLSDGRLLVEGKAWTGFTNAEEDFADAAVGMKIQPYRIEDEALKISNTTFKTSDPFSAYAIQDGLLITGQQQNSGAVTAELVIETLSTIKK